MVKNRFNSKSKAPGYAVNAGQTPAFWLQRQQKEMVSQTGFVFLLEIGLV